MRQRQFLDVVDDATASARVREACAHLAPKSEMLPLEEAWGRVLHTELCAPVDVPGFDRSNVDGFAVRASDTYGAQETEGRSLSLRPERLAAGRPALPEGFELGAGEAISIATGAILPRGADAVVMIEDTAPVKPGVNVQAKPVANAPEAETSEILVFRAVAPGAWITGAGTDIGRGEVVLRRRQPLGSRETALAAAVGAAQLEVFRRPRVAIISTGDEIRPPGAELQVGDIHDSNGRVLADAVRECGGEPLAYGIIGDDIAALTAALKSALSEADFILMSGGTSKGAGDLNHRVVAELATEIDGSAGIIVHGVALKPGKPFCFARVGASPIAILPGFPTSAIFTFHEFIAPELRRLSGHIRQAAPTLKAHAPMRLPSALGRTEYLLVDLVESDEGLAAYPLGKGSGSVSTFSAADGFLRIDRLVEYLEEGAEVEVHPLGAEVRRPDLLAIGSHCVGLDDLLSRLSDRGLSVKSIHVGSQGGLRALARGEGDVAGMHLLDEESGLYNRPFLDEDMEIIGGYGRRQGFVSRPGDERFADLRTDQRASESAAVDALAQRVQADDLVMVNRNRGSGTRIIIDKFLESGGGARPRGYHADARSHHAVAAAVAQGRADWGITIEALARAQNLDFVFLCDERYEFVTRRARRDRPGVRALRDLLEDETVRAALRTLGFEA